MAGLGSGLFLRRGITAAGLAAAMVVGASGAADARPVRGPLMRAERRVARAQAVLERELARPQDRPRAAERIAAQARDAASPTPAAKPDAPAKAAAAPAAPANPLALPARGGVAQATFEAPAATLAPTPAAASDAANAAALEPAADGTISVLVRPEGEAGAKPAQAGEPLRFPDPSTP